ncbi:hypothetical protein HQQ80_06995 [Microbacteriaceae bacterium VKM Ac-2855]|nr:hypothetical protein [Microbacteriaceae bacterium VKM Ac-2855]
MVDARMPERYLLDRRIGRLSDAEFRSYITATIWSVSNRTDGVIVADDLPLIPRFSTSAVLAFVALALWVETGDGRWLICDFAQTQTSKHELEVVENMRRRDREKKARQRAAKAGLEAEPSPAFADVPGDVPRDVSPGQHRQGQARKERHVVGDEEPAWRDVEVGSLTAFTLADWERMPEKAKTAIESWGMRPDERNAS